MTSVDHDEDGTRAAIAAAAETVVAKALAAGRRVTIAESCTGGLVSAALTEVPGASAMFGLGFVTYANAAKTDALGVPAALIARRGAVSAEVAAAMASGAREAARADVAVAITGVAGPGGGSPSKPVGLVHFAVATAAGVAVTERRYGDVGRARVRAAAVLQALAMLDAALVAAPPAPTPPAPGYASGAAPIAPSSRP